MVKNVTDTAVFSKDDPTAPGHYEPSRTAVLLMDYHNAILKRAGNEKTGPMIDVAVGMRKWAKAKGIPVIHCLIDANSAPFLTCKDRVMFEQIADVLRTDGEEPSALMEGGGDLTFTRRLGYVSAFRSPGLEEYLQTHDIRSLLLLGLTTSGCVLRTAAAATDLEFVVTTISDGCVDFDAAVHDCLVDKVLQGRGHVVSSRQFQTGYRW